MPNHTRTLISKQAGLTLIELMVGMSLGLLLTAIIGTMYLSSKISFTTSTQVARVQENTRFATHFLLTDLRAAGYTECGNVVNTNILLDELDPEYITEATSSGIFGWEYTGETGTDINNTYPLVYTKIDKSSTQTDIDNAKTANTTTASKWQDNQTPTAGNLPTILTSFSPLKGSDILIITSEEKTDLVLTQMPNTNRQNIGITSGTTQIGQGVIIKIGNCNQQDKFQNFSDGNANGLTAGSGGNSGNFNPGNVNPGTFTWSQAWGPNDSVYTETTKAYYVGTGSSGVPALFVYESLCNLSTTGSGCPGITNLELVEGVENMQILYGEDTDAPKDKIANIYRSANQVANFGDVVSIRISLLMRSNDSGRDANDTNNYVLSDLITINPPDERFLRYVTNMTIHLRNRGL